MQNVPAGRALDTPAFKYVTHIVLATSVKFFCWQQASKQEKHAINTVDDRGSKEGQRFSSLLLQGHSRPRTLQQHHYRLLQKCSGRFTCLRRNETRDLRELIKMVEPFRRGTFSYLK